MHANATLAFIFWWSEGSEGNPAETTRQDTQMQERKIKGIYNTGRSRGSIPEERAFDYMYMGNIKGITTQERIMISENE